MSPKDACTLSTQEQQRNFTASVLKNESIEGFFLFFFIFACPYMYHYDLKHFTHLENLPSFHGLSFHSLQSEDKNNAN